MDVPSCPGCLLRDARIAELERLLAQMQEQFAQLQQQLLEQKKRVAELEARLNINSSNSSTPPSRNPPGAPKNTKKASNRNRGGQRGHPPHLKQLLPPERVTKIVPIVPEKCSDCDAPLPAEAGPDDTQIKRFQTIELPEIVVEVVEYQAHARTCPCCAKVNQAVIPAEIRKHSIGPRLTATLSYLTGNLGLSKRNVEEICDDLFGVPMALGTVCNLEREVSAALEAPHREALQAVQQSKVAFGDETSWKLWGKLCWLWAMATASVAAFLIHPKRSALGFAAILGETFDGLLHSDRYHVYHRIPPENRQICWAHLKRDFQKVLDRGGGSAFVGKKGLRLVKEVFAAWHEFQEGKVTRQQLKSTMASLEFRMNRVLLEGALGDDARVAKFCDNVLKLETALWTFVDKEGVEPTNNFMERLMRLAVLWRKRSFGCNSEAGCRYVERILTAVQTCRLRGRSVLEYLRSAVAALRQGKPAPSLVD